MRKLLLALLLAGCYDNFDISKYKNGHEKRERISELTDEYLPENESKLEEMGIVSIRYSSYEDCAEFAFKDHMPRKLMMGEYNRWQEIFPGYTKTEKPEKGDLAVYIDDEPKHFGIYAGKGKVISVYGNIPHIWRHELFDVPLSYGDEIKFYSYE